MENCQNIEIISFRQSSLTEPVNWIYRIEESFIVTDSAIVELYLKIMAAITTKNTMKTTKTMTTKTTKTTARV